METVNGESNCGLLELLIGGIVADQIFEDGEDMLSVQHNFFEDGTKFRSAHGFLVPFGEDGGGHLNVATQFIGGMTAKKQAVEKGCFALRELEIQQRLLHRVGDCGHVRNRSLPISLPTSRVHERKSKYTMLERSTVNQEIGTKLARRWRILGSNRRHVRRNFRFETGFISLKA